MVETNEEAMTRASVATDFIMELLLLEGGVLVAAGWDERRIERKE